MKDHELQAVLDNLSDVSGGGTWHISVYIRPSKRTQQVRNEMAQEMAEAESIKSDDTQERVQSSLSNIRTALDGRDTPENGMAVFSSPNEVWVLDDLPFEVSQNLYHCGKSFVVDPLYDDYDTSGTYGLIVIERGESAVGVLRRGRVEDATVKESMVMGKTQAGGQSQTRFERLREEQKHEFFKETQQTASTTFQQYDMDGVVIGGTISSAKEFVEDYVPHDWNVIGTYSVEYASEQGLDELVSRASADISDEDEREARDTVEKFFNALRENEAAYGDNLDIAIEYGAVDTLICTRDVGVDRINELAERVENQGGSVVVFDPSFEKGHMFDQMTGGVGAILRFEVAP